MFIGHFAAGFAAKKWAPATSLGTLFLAAQFLDLLWPTFLLLGLERVEIDPGNTAVTPLNFVHYPLTHSLIAALLWALAFALVYLWAKRRGRNAFVLGLLVLSHWILDFLTHRPDLPLVPGGSLFVGLSLWSSVAGTLVLEFFLFGLGVWLYLRATQARDRIGTWALWGLVGFLAVMHVGNIFGPPPPSVKAISGAGHAQWLLVAWGYWIDRHRFARAGIAPSP